MKENSFKILLSILITASIVRVLNFNFPFFTSDEARIVYRGHTLSTTGRDELGRFLPLLFNSSTDYQLPAVSYITAAGEKIFSKTDLGARIPFIIFGVALIIITYKIARLFSDKKIFWILSATVLLFSPVLIFLSKMPNDLIVLAFLITLLFYLLARDKLNMILVISVIILSLTVSKFAWFIIPPFVLFTLLFYQNNLSRKIKIMLSVFSLATVLVIMGFYLQVPQSRRSLSENNFSLFSSTSIINGINRMRGQGIKSGWPNYAETILFNKSDFLIIGFMHWLSNLQPGNYFGQLDKTGQLNFSQMGAFAKILIIPFVGGLIYVIRKGKEKERLLLIFFLILTFPAIFIYPSYSPGLIILTLPFAALVIAFGFMQFRKTVSSLIILVMILELGLSLSYLSPEKKNANFLRPEWVKELTEDIYYQSISYRTGVSDDIVEDIVNFIEWYNPLETSTVYVNVPYPYKFRQSGVGNIKIIGSDKQLYFCKEITFDKVFISKRDKNKIEDSGIKIIRTYFDGSGQEVSYLLEKGLCIK